ncbi:MAG: tRNA pseudouridine(38-40) synthase TruA [Haloarculaceae archaeon]
MRAYRLAYDGRPYHGFQRQPDVPTVEDALLDALRDLGALDGGADKPEGYAAAGRTDSGVSARAQTVAFGAPDWLTPRALNAELPAAVRAWASADVDPAFHATHDARERTYVYHLYAPRAGSATRAPFDDDSARAALETLAGERDFHNLTPDERGTSRDLAASAERDGAFLVVTLRAGGFARQLVRRVVGLVAEVGRGECGLERVERVLGPDPLDGPAGVAPAAAEPLVLWDVDYPGVAFTVDERAAESARASFDDRHADRVTAATVAAGLRSGVGDP